MKAGTQDQKPTSLKTISGACYYVTRGWKYAAYLFVQSTDFILFLDF